MLEDNIAIPSGVDISSYVSETMPGIVEYSCSRGLGLEWQLQSLSGRAAVVYHSHSFVKWEFTTYFKARSVGGN